MNRRRDEAHEQLLAAAANAIQRVSAAILVFDRRKKGRRCDRCARMGIHTMVWIDPGKKGQCDIYVIFPGGRHGEVEIKTGTGRLEPEQLAWRLECEKRRIPYLLLEMKDPSQLAACVERARAWATYVLGAKHDADDGAASPGEETQDAQAAPEGASAETGDGPPDNQRGGAGITPGVERPGPRRKNQRAPNH